VFLRVGGIAFVISLAFWLYCLLDAITADQSRVRNLPKGAWILIVLVLLDIGAILWLIAGRPRGTAADTPYRVDRGNLRGPTVPPRRRPPVAPDDDPEFLANLSRRQDEEPDAQPLGGRTTPPRRGATPPRAGRRHRPRGPPLTHRRCG
jgi:phospholipase D-like protein